jgi:hypothetical protein
LINFISIALGGRCGGRGIERLLELKIDIYLERYVQKECGDWLHGHAARFRAGSRALEQVAAYGVSDAA